MTSTLDPDTLAARKRVDETPPGHDAKSLGPSDSSDSGSDMAGPGLIDDDALGLDRGTHTDTEAGRDDIADAETSIGDIGMDANTDRHGTGERMTAGKEPAARANADRDTDRVVDAQEAGLGRGLDQAEEAQFGIRDEELDEARRARDAAA